MWEGDLVLSKVRKKYQYNDHDEVTVLDKRKKVWDKIKKKKHR